MALTPMMVQILDMLNDNDGQPVVCTTERSMLAAEGLRELGYVHIESRMVPRFPDNGRAIYTLQQEQLRVCAYYVTFTDHGLTTYGVSNV